MNREKMIEELSEYLVSCGGDIWSSPHYATASVDYMLEKFGLLVEAAQNMRGGFINPIMRRSYTEFQSECANSLIDALKQLEDEE